MSDAGPAFETQDLSGNSRAFNGTATTTVTNLSFEGRCIQTVGIVTFSENLEVSYDNGVTFDHVTPGSTVWNVKGFQTQLPVRATLGTADYRIIINFEDA